MASSESEPQPAGEGGAPPPGREAQVKIAFPLWGIGAAVALWGLLRGRPLLFLLGVGAFFADRDAGPVRRVRELVG